MTRPSLWNISFFIAIFAAVPCVSNPIKTNFEHKIAENKPAPKSLNDRLTSFLKGLGYVGMGIASVIGIYTYSTKTYDYVKVDHYELIRRHIFPVPEPQNPDYVATMEKARQEANNKAISVGGCLFLCSIIVYLNYHLQVPQNAWRYTKNAFN